jgi:hypothetical protein
MAWHGMAAAASVLDWVAMQDVVSFFGLFVWLASYMTAQWQHRRAACCKSANQHGQVRCNAARESSSLLFILAGVLRQRCTKRLAWWPARGGLEIALLQTTGSAQGVHSWTFQVGFCAMQQAGHSSTSMTTSSLCHNSAAGSVVLSLLRECCSIGLRVCGCLCRAGLLDFRLVQQPMLMSAMYMLCVL